MVAISKKSKVGQTDDKGRVLLGTAFSNRSVLIDQLSDSEFVIKLARVIPESEAWLYENPQALKSVRNGLAQARAKKFVNGPNLKADAKFAEKLED